MRVADGSGFVELCNAERKWEQTHCITPPGDQGRLKIRAGEKWKIQVSIDRSEPEVGIL